MNPSARNQWCRGVLLLLCALLLAEFFTGMFPFSPVEGDEQAVINGLREMIRPVGADLRWRYTYPLQPGSYWITIGIHHLTHADVGQCYFALSAICATLFALLSAALIRAIGGIDFIPALVLALLCQEIQRAACYANSSTVGGCLVLAGLLVGARRADARTSRVVIAGVLIGLGAWCRLDALVLAPAFFFFRHEETLHRAVIETLQAALVAILTLVGLYAMIHVGWRDIMEIYSGRDTDAGYGRTFAGFYQVSSLGILLAAGWGAWICGRRREWMPGMLFLAVLAPSLFLYSKSLTTPKYFYYLTPFLAILAAAGVADFFKNRRRWLGGTILAVTVAEWLTGVRTTRTEFRRFTPNPTIATIAPVNLGSRRMVWVVGSGEVLGNDDGLSLRTGLAFAGTVWHSEKTRALDELAALQHVLETNPKLAVLTSTYASYQCTAGLLRVAGFECASRSEPIRAMRPATWIDGSKETGPAGWLGSTRVRRLPRFFRIMPDVTAISPGISSTTWARPSPGSWPRPRCEWTR